MMDDALNALSPPPRLAIAYAPSDVREAFSLLLEFDAKLRGVVINASEILIGQLKLAWWREAIAADAGQRPKGEPLLARIGALETQDIRPELEMLLTAWECLLLGDGDPSALRPFAQDRGCAIFGGYARIVNLDADVHAAGVEWALRDLKGPDGGDEVLIPRQRRLRPLSIMLLSVCDVSGPRMIWRALTGR
jgi:15-cis-phytoene synthase